MDLDSGVEILSQPSTNPVLLDNECNIILISLGKLFLKCLSMIGCLVLIAVIFLG
jgi:hypothetical protein